MSKDKRIIATFSANGNEYRIIGRVDGDSCTWVEVRGVNAYDEVFWATASLSHAERYGCIARALLDGTFKVVDAVMPPKETKGRIVARYTVGNREYRIVRKADSEDLPVGIETPDHTETWSEISIQKLPVTILNEILVALAEGKLKINDELQEKME